MRSGSRDGSCFNSNQVKIIKGLQRKPKQKPPLDVRGFLKKGMAVEDRYGGRIIGQQEIKLFLRLGQRTFTMDEGCSKAVEDVFVKMYENGQIYKGKRIVNWCPVYKTSISDAEVLYEDQPSHLWHKNIL